MRMVCLKKAKRGIINRLLRGWLLFESEVEGRQDRQILIVGETEAKVGEHLLMVSCRCERLSSWVLTVMTVFRKIKGYI